VPLVVSRRIGKGMTVTVNIDDLWRWDFFPTSEAASRLYKDFWIELAQWMAVYGDFLPGRRVAVRLSAASAGPGEPVKAVVRSRGPAAAGGTAPPALQVREGERMVQDIALHADSGAGGEWSAVFSLPEPGLYRVEAALGSDTDATAQAVLRVERPPSERQDASADPAFLARLAELSGGKSIEEQDLEKTVRSFQPREASEAEGEPVWVPYWDRGAAAMLLMGLLAGEWFWRRRNGLM
jgi:hypothetical protein